MLRILLVALSCCVAACPSPGTAAETASVWTYLGTRAGRLAAQLPPLPESVEAWEKHRAESSERLGRELGLPQRQPMQAVVLDQRVDGDLVFEEIAFHWAEQVYASGTVIRGRQQSGPLPAIVLTPDWLGHRTFRAYRSFVEDVARDGVLVLFVDDPRTGRRQSSYAGLYATASAAGMQVAGIQVFDALRALDYLRTRADVDAGKIGIAGLGEGALRAYLCAALEPQIQFVVVIAGTTTYESLVQAAADNRATASPSAFVGGMLTWTDMDRVAACVAPRPVLIAGGAGRWPTAGSESVLYTLRTVYGLYDADDRLRVVRGKVVDEMTPYTAAVTQWLKAEVFPSLRESSAAPTECGEPAELDFRVLGYLQRRMENQMASRFDEPLTPAAWTAHRQAVVDWLRPLVAANAGSVLADQVLESAEEGSLVVERLALGVDDAFRCPAVVVRPASGDVKSPGIVLSHDDRQSYAAARISEAARRLARAGYWVIVPEHASVDPQSEQPLADAEAPSFYGDEAARFYGPADAVGRPPLALRAAETLAAFRHLVSRAEVDESQIVVAGAGLGGVDASLAALLDERIGGVAAVDATTCRDWSVQTAPGELHFFHLMPYLPSLLTVTDLDCAYASLAPRPVVLVRLNDGWSRSGFEQAAARCAEVYGMLRADDALRVLAPRDMTEEREAAEPMGVRRQLFAAARVLAPTPPTPGLVGNLDLLKNRSSVDSASGLIWLVGEISGYEQEFAGKGYRVETWSFFNDNRDSQQGRSITPLIFRKLDAGFELTGIGTARSNSGNGLQNFDFEPVAGSDTVGDGYFFGWYDGDAAGAPNAGVVEFDNAPDARMTILTGDGQMGGQRVQLGRTYRIQSEFRRQYSIMAVSKKTP
ncbi:MAG: dienelactone hydrolase family protein [Pirellulaceae bacterium]|nr:dienelactone hydrolase family protein [Pirellulaceae bacterium]